MQNQQIKSNNKRQHFGTKAGECYHHFRQTEPFFRYKGFQNRSYKKSNAITEQSLNEMPTLDSQFFEKFSLKGLKYVLFVVEEIAFLEMTRQWLNAITEQSLNEMPISYLDLGTKRILQFLRENYRALSQNAKNCGFLHRPET